MKKNQGLKSQRRGTKRREKILKNRQSRIDNPRKIKTNLGGKYLSRVLSGSEE